MHSLLGRFFLFLTMLPLMHGCSGKNLIKEHEIICKDRAAVIIHDANLWREYRPQAELAFQQNRQRWGPETGKALFEPVDGFSRVYGEGKADSRHFTDDKIVRNDIFLMKGEKTVVQLVDFTVAFQTIETKTGFSCLRFVPSLYNLGDKG
jgi:hypothetical protein